MNRVAAAIALLCALVLASSADAKYRTRTHHFQPLYGMQNLNDDALLGVEPIGAKVRGMCTCECCTPEPPRKTNFASRAPPNACFSF